MNIPVYFSEALVAPVQGFSPSPAKPGWVASALQEGAFPVEFRAPKAATLQDLFRAHDRGYVEGVLSGHLENGHGTTDLEFSGTLPYSCGAMLEACRAARPGRPAAALVSGFHHAGWAWGGGYCTFNGLMVAALALLAEDCTRRVAIVDVDMHYGNGTDDILDRLEARVRDRIFHDSFGCRFHSRSQASAYLDRMKSLHRDLEAFGPNLILYQAGADPHVNDPLGGILSTAQMRQRDRRMFQIARDLARPLAWNLAGGYQRDRTAIVGLHLQTFQEAMKVYNAQEISIGPPASPAA
jgi:acetoin utilization deacetylase AcuC-like enzyme